MPHKPPAIDDYIVRRCEAMIRDPLCEVNLVECDEGTLDEYQDTAIDRNGRLVRVRIIVQMEEIQIDEDPE